MRTMLHLCTNVHTMDPGYQWDHKKAAANVAKHGVDFADAVAVFDDPFAITIPDPDAVGEARFVILGLTH